MSELRPDHGKHQNSELYLKVVKAGQHIGHQQDLMRRLEFRSDQLRVYDEEQHVKNVSVTEPEQDG